MSFGGCRVSPHIVVCVGAFVIAPSFAGYAGERAIAPVVTPAGLPLTMNSGSAPVLSVTGELGSVLDDLRIAVSINDEIFASNDGAKALG
jgi:hypothetical protein